MSCHPSHPLFLSSIIISGRSSLVIWPLTIRRADSRPPFNHHRAFPLYIQDAWFERKVIYMQNNTRARTFLPQATGAWGGCRDATAAHECHIIHQSVTGCRPGFSQRCCRSVNKRERTTRLPGAPCGQTVGAGQASLAMNHTLAPKQGF